MSSSRAETSLASPVAQRPRRLRLTWFRGRAGLGRALRDAAYRAADLTGALLLLVALSPLLAVRALVALRTQGVVLERHPRVGRNRAPFTLLVFAGDAPLRSLAALWNVLRGDLSLAGPRPLAPDEADRVPPDALVRFAVRPGFVSRHALQARTGLAHDAEDSADREHYYEQTLRGDLGLVARSIPARLLGRRAPSDAPPRLDFFGVEIANGTMEEAVAFVVERAARADVATTLAFVNPDCLNVAWGDAEYRRVLAACDRVLPDGIGLHLGCRLLGTALRANVNGTDLFPRLCERLSESGASIYLLGARPGVAAAAAAAMRARYPGLGIAGTRDGYFAESEDDAVVDEINRSGAAVLLVALGAPRQELWLARHRDRLRVPVRMGVGGLFDFYSGRVERAPAWIREIGMEWAWRLLQEPGRLWRRYLVGNWVFLFRVWRQARGASPGAAT